MSLMEVGVAVPGSTMDRFNCGNLKSLKKDGIRDALLTYLKDWYSANIMKVCLIGNHSLDQLEAWARTYFSPIVNKSLILPPLDPTPSFTHDCLAKLLRWVPVKDEDILTFAWPSMPYCQLEHRT